jgi:hypothetical protein
MIEIENIIDVKLQDALEKFITSTSFPWFYSHNTITTSELLETNKIALEQGINPPQFVHNIILDSKQNTQFFHLIQPILEELANYLKQNFEVRRAKFNLLPKNSDSTYHYPHIDTEVTGVHTLIYYVNESDGDTYLFDGIGPSNGEFVEVQTRFTPKKGTAIIFDANQFHSSSSPVEHEKRIVLNVMFKNLD